MLDYHPEQSCTSFTKTEFTTLLPSSLTLGQTLVSTVGSCVGACAADPRCALVAMEIKVRQGQVGKCILGEHGATLTYDPDYEVLEITRIDCNKPCN